MSERLEVTIDKSEVERQTEFINKIKIMNNMDYEQGAEQKYFVVHTYGCQMNARDSEKLIGMLVEMGYKQTEDEDLADIIFFNTCCVRENAENKVYGNVGYLKKFKEKKPNLKIVLCGCMMQQDAVVETIRQSYKQVDIIFGTYNIYRFPELLSTSFETNQMVIDVWQEHRDIVEDLPSQREFPHKASVNIMYGCDNFCTYCIVPYVRGRERSRTSEDIIREVKELVADGVYEIMLLGQNVNSYGQKLEEEITFAGLLRKLNEVEGLERIRFMTSHPKDISDELIQTMAECDKVCKQLHLPVQSGSNALLKAMNRKYTREQYLETVKKVKAAMPDITLTTDIIVGFPGETDQDNEDTISLIEEVGYTAAFTFIYSLRSGTIAAKMENHVEEKVAKERFNKLVKALNEGISEKNKTYIGKTLKVLVEDVSKDDKYLTGRTDGFNLVHVATEDKDLIGKFVEVKITDCKTFYLVGELA